MASPSLPVAFAFLLEEPNQAADGALIETLPDLEPPVQAAALEILLTRAHAPSLAGVVGRFREYGDALQELILARAGELAAGARVAIASPSFEDRASAIDLVVRSDSARSAYLLADAVRSRCRRTRELAAAGLNRMTGRLLDHLEDGQSPERVTALDDQAACLAEALATAVHRWEIHSQPEVLRAALSMGDRVEPAILQKLTQRRTKIHRMLNKLLEGTSDPRLAGAALRALAVPELRSAAARSISRADHAAFLQAVFWQCWLLADERIERGCRWVRDGTWLRDALAVLANLDGAALGGAVRFLAAIGGSPERKIEVFRELIGFDREEVRRAAIWQLVREKSEAATRLLGVVANRQGDVVAHVASREWRRRRGSVSGGESCTATGKEPGTAPHAEFERYWNRFDGSSDEERSTTGDAIRRHVADLGVLLRARLASADPLDRARAVRMVSSLGCVEEMEESLQHLASDPDPLVRSLVVNRLAEMPGPTTLRLLRAAVNDPDARVQADAVEALDRLDIEERLTWTEPKLESPNSRVRANAVKSLLRAELHKAGETLLNMLEDPSPAHRLSVLWVIERLGLEAVVHRIRDLSRDDSNERVRRRAIHVLNHLNRRKAADARRSSPAPANVQARQVGGSV